MTELAADVPRGPGGSVAAARRRPSPVRSEHRSEHRSEQRVEPEQALADFPVRIDTDTLREIVDDPWPLEQIRFELTKKLALATNDAARARLAGLRAVSSRLLGKLNEALDEAELSLRYATATGSARRVAVAQTRLARVLQWRGDHGVADELYQRALDAPVTDRLRAAIQHYFGTSCYEQGRFLEALQRLETSLALSPQQHPEWIAVTNNAFTAISRRASTEGFGPFPRSRAEILQEKVPPKLRFHEGFGRYGYVAADGTAVIAPAYHEAYPFSGGVAWVRADESVSWSLIDIEGRPALSATDYETVGPFSEGLAWVLSDPMVGWFAIDTHGLVVVPPAGYQEAHPFHAGLAVVARNGVWGAVDRDGREVVPMEYDAFRTATSDAGYVTGFTTEGLAVVERKGRLGVINRHGDVVVPMKYQQIEIHPVGYLVLPPVTNPDYSNPFRSTVDLSDGWGALDRRGEVIVKTVHPSREAVLEEVERLLPDARPVL